MRTVTAIIRAADRFMAEHPEKFVKRDVPAPKQVPSLSFSLEQYWSLKRKKEAENKG